MSANERPVPAVGQVWRQAGALHTLYAKEPNRDGWSTCEVGSKDNDGFVHGPWDCCWVSTYALMESGTLVRHAPTPETAPGLPGQPTTSVGSGSAAGRTQCVHCLSSWLTVRNEDPNNPILHAIGCPVRKPAMAAKGETVCGVQGAGRLGDYCTRRQGHPGDHVCFEEWFAANKPAPKPQRVTYASLLASLRAEEGVPPPKKCSGCGETPCHPRTHMNRDAHVALTMDLSGHGLMAHVVEEPWRPSVDPLFDIPEWNEFGSRKP